MPACLPGSAWQHTPERFYRCSTGVPLKRCAHDRAGMPVSSTHCQIGSIVAVGLVERGLSSVQWSVFYKILAAWGVTVPLAAVVAAALLAALRPVLA